MTEKDIENKVETLEVENPTEELKDQSVPETPETPEIENEEDSEEEFTDDDSVEEIDDHADIQPVAEIKAAIATDDDDDFDWEEAESGYSSAERKRLEELFEGTLTELSEGEIVDGTVLSIGPKEVILNIGFKSEGMVQTTEFRDMPDMKPGDTVEVYLESIEDKNGQLVLSRKRAKHMRTWNMILNAEEEDVILEGLIKRRTKGGFVVDIAGIEAFLPGSQIDVKPVRDFDAFVGKVMDFKVVKINHQFNNVVVSHKVLIEKDLEKQRQEILKNLEKGQVLEGTVKNMTNFGVFIDLGGVDGLLHITDISWGRINHPEEVLQLDQKINIVVLDFDAEKKRISLGLKQLQPHPWDSLPETIVEGSVIKGKVVTIAEYGLFIELQEGVEGLVHLSEMSWSQHLKDPSELFKVGDMIDAVVLSIDKEDHKMSLGIKQTTEDPWSKAAEKYPVESKHKGIVRGQTNYGLFVELEEGIDGLVHISDLSWTKKFSHPSEFIKIGEELEVIVLDIDITNRRLSLGHKQLTEDVWETFETIFVEGSKHKGTLLRRDDKGAIVEVEYGIEGFVPKRHLATEEGQPDLKVGTEYEYVVVEFNKDAKKLVLSHALTWNDDLEIKAKPAAGKADGGKKKSGSPARSPKAETTLLGDIGALQDLKKAMEANSDDAGADEAAAKKAKADAAKEAKKAKAAEAKAEKAKAKAEADAAKAEAKAEKAKAKAEDAKSEEE